ncbi:WxL protein peptidoglycan domain-containing protein [Actinoplanes sp. CA-015351]|uniref:WxL protein peptidoglycan domain-containing protein n=1 Tax=Actinoplanes sp. CA-015351 TaxID=3239897 RepID=UPI003D971F71
MRKIAAVLVIAAMVLLTPAPAAATGNGEWAVTPTPAKNPGPTPRLYFFLDASAGERVKESVRVTNLTAKPRSFVIYGADAYNTVRNGGFAIRTRTDQQTDLGSWVKSQVTAVEVPARTSADIPFTIDVPANATPGDHVGGIVAMEASASTTAQADGATVNIQRAVAARVYLRVAGAVVPGLGVPELDLNVGPLLLPTLTGGDLEYTVANVGNVHLVPAATVKVTGLFGHKIKVAGATPASDMIPGAKGTFAMTASGIWPLDVVTTSVAVRADGDVFAQRSERTLVISWTAVALLALLITAVVLLIRRRTRSRELRPRGLVAAR